MSGELVNWLNEQIDEDEREAVDDGWQQPGPRRMLCEVAAKRRLIDEILAYEAKIDGEWGCGHMADQIAAGLCPDSKPEEIPALRLLAEIFSDRPGYQEAWRP